MNNITAKNIELASAYVEEMRQLVNSCCEDVKNANTASEAWNTLNKCYQDIEALRNNPKYADVNTFMLETIVGSDTVAGHTKYLQGINLPIMVNTVKKNDNELLPSDVCEMHIGKVDGVKTVLITPEIISI